MIPRSWSPLEKDELLRSAFSHLRPRGISSVWTEATQPFTELQREASALMNDESFRAALARYLRVRTSVPRAVEMLFTIMAMAARADWRSVEEPSRGIAARGWFLGRWLPTFLIIDGPIGRLMADGESPLPARLGPATPYLSAARDFLMDRTFRLMRNSLAHWSFDWEVVGDDSYIVAYDWERDLPHAKLHQAEADAYHIAAFAVVEVLHDVMLCPRDAKST